MGDRANVYITDQNIDGMSLGIYAYTHWSGEDWPEQLRKALADATGRWGDPQYATRLIVRSLFADLRGDTGGGLSTFLGDNNSYPILICDVTTDTVAFAAEGDERRCDRWYGHTPFADFVAQHEASWPAEVPAQ